jgi:hypothetical protein
MALLKRYWFEFVFPEDEEMVFQLAFGCGVTASSPQEATAIVMKQVFAGREMPALKRVLEGVDIDSLDEKYVRPFVGDTRVKGIWFPPYAAGPEGRRRGRN